MGLIEDLERLRGRVARGEVRLAPVEGREVKITYQRRRGSKRYNRRSLFAGRSHHWVRRAFRET